MGRKKLSLTFVLSLIPGLGHYYLGFNHTGLKFMIAAFACISLIPAFPMVFPFALATIWFYQIFDALQKSDWLNRHQDLLESPIGSNPSTLYEELERESRNVSTLWTGVGIIGAGVLVILVTVFPELRDWILEPKNGSLLIAVGLIAYGGILIARHLLSNRRGR